MKKASLPPKTPCFNQKLDPMTSYEALYQDKKN
jgi:hypothetical protein